MDTENDQQAEQRRNEESDPEITDRIRASRTVASRMTQAFGESSPFDRTDACLFSAADRTRKANGNIRFQRRERRSGARDRYGRVLQVKKNVSTAEANTASSSGSDDTANAIESAQSGLA